MACRFCGFEKSTKGSLLNSVKRIDSAVAIADFLPGAERPFYCASKEADKLRSAGKEIRAKQPCTRWSAVYSNCLFVELGWPLAFRTLRALGDLPRIARYRPLARTHAPPVHPPKSGPSHASLDGIQAIGGYTFPALVGISLCNTNLRLYLAKIAAVLDAKRRVSRSSPLYCWLRVPEVRWRSSRRTIPGCAAETSIPVSRSPQYRKRPAPPNFSSTDKTASMRSTL